MQLWKRLYNTVWLAFFLCVLIPRWMGPYAGLPLHAILGLLMLILTQSNARKLAALPVPARLKRISKVTAGFAIFQIICGLAMGGVSRLTPNLPFLLPALRGVHIVCALTMLAQASSVATAYDMWEEKEFN
jgi:membrane protease YdiL (CAAX protease family)